MPFTLNGCGTSVCPARGLVAWTKGKWYSSPALDYDALECLVFFFLPIIPYRAIHTFDWNGSNYRRIPLRWSGTLILKAFLRRWLVGVSYIGCILTFIGLFLPDPDRWSLLGYGIIIVLFSGGGLYSLHFLDERTRNIRRLLGKHSYGSSDPATWHPSLLSNLKTPKELFGTNDFCSAVMTLLKDGKLSSAMWAARLSSALEDKTVGEKLTNEVFADGQVKVALYKIKRNPARWKEFVILPDPVLN